MKTKRYSKADKATILRVLKQALVNKKLCTYGWYFICLAIERSIITPDITEADIALTLHWFSNQRPSETQYKRFYNHESCNTPPWSSWWVTSRGGYEQRIKFLKHLIAKLKKELAAV